MKVLFAMTFFLLAMSLAGQDADEIMLQVDANMSSKTRIVETKMTIKGRRASRTVISKSYSEGGDRSLTEYLAPDREKGTKMLKLENRLWIYNPSSDRTIQLSGHMLRQSVMGSDLSYEDMMEDRPLLEIYNASLVGEELIEDVKCWVVQLQAKEDDVSYAMRKTWIDQEKFVPLREQLFAKSGKLLKTTELSKVKKVDGRWFPTKMKYKDELKKGGGTDFEFISLEFDPKIPDHLLTKASLR